MNKKHYQQQILSTCDGFFGSGRNVQLSGDTKQIARQRVQFLFELAETIYRTNPQLAQRYVETARRIAMSARLSLPTAFTRRICKKCHSILVPGDNSRVRIKPRREPHVVVTCLNCSNQKRIPLKPKTKLKTEIE